MTLPRRTRRLGLGRAVRHQSRTTAARHRPVSRRERGLRCSRKARCCWNRGPSDRINTLAAVPDVGHRRDRQPDGIECSTHCSTNSPGSAASATRTTTIAATCCTISRETKTAILAAMGCATSDAAAIERELRERETGRLRSLLPPVAVVHPHRNGVTLAVPADALEQRARLAHRHRGRQRSPRTRARRGAARNTSGAKSTAAGRRGATCRCPATCRTAITRCTSRSTAVRADPAHSSWRRCPVTSPGSCTMAGGCGAWRCSSIRCARSRTGASAISPTWPPSCVRARSRAPPSSASIRCTRCSPAIRGSSAHTARRHGTS